MTNWKAQQSKAEAAMLGTNCRQDDESSRRLIDDLHPEAITRTIEAIRARLGGAAGDWWTKPPSEWGRVQANLFAAQYDDIIKAETIAAGGVRA